MAKKIDTASDRNLEAKTEVYPWLRLLELEVQPQEHPTPRRGKGRPPNPFPRRPVHVTLTDDELAALDGLAQVLSERLGHVHRGHLIAFMAFYLRSRLQNGERIELPPEINTFSTLAGYLDSTKRGL